MHHERDMELRKVRKLLHALLDLAEQSSLTGVFSGGVASAVRRYNALLRHLEEEDLMPEEIFEQLNEDQTGFDRLGVEIKLLLSYLEEDEPQRLGGHGHGHGHRGGDFDFLVGIAPFVDRHELSKLVEEQISKGAKMHEGVLMALAPFIDRGMMGQLLRKMVGEVTEPPTPPVAPEPPVAPTPPAPVAEPSRAVVPQADASQELARLSAELAQPGLSAERRTEIAIELGQMAHQQALEAQREDS